MLLDADVLLRHKAVKVITAHGGAFVPYQPYRLAAVGPKGLPGAPERRQQLQSLYFDTTMAGKAPSAASARLLLGDALAWLCVQRVCVLRGACMQWRGVQWS